MITPALNITATERVLPRLALDFTTGVVDSRITFSRGSIATVISSDGALKWAGHNLLSDSESFNASAWIKSSVTVGANSIAAPDGATTADTLTASGSNGTTLQAWTALGHPATFAVWLRRKTGTGTVEIAADSGTYTAVTITSNWALYTVTQTPAAGSRNAGIRIVTSGDEVYVWGAHLYYSNLGGMVLNPARNDTYYPTTVRNLLGWSEDFTNAAWSRTAITSITANTEIAPNGLRTADTVVFAGGSSEIKQLYSLTATNPRTFSVYLKGTAGETILIGHASGTTSKMVTLTGDWQREFITDTAASPSGGFIGTWGGATARTIFVWGAQVSDSASLDPYVVQPIAAPANAPYYAPRLDYSPTSIGTPRGLLIEEQRTNIFLNSENLAAAFPGATNATIVNGSGFATLTDNSTSGTHLVNGNNLFAPDGVTRCWSIEFKGGTARYAIISHSDSFTSTLNTYIFDTQTGTWTSTTTDTLYALAFFTPQNMGDGWWRVCFSSNLNSAFYDNFAIGISNGPNFADRSYSGTGSTILVRRPQIESGAFPTSYMPTTTASLQRNADVVSMTGTNFSDWYNATEGTLQVIGSMNTASTSIFQVFAMLGDANNGLQIFNNLSASRFRGDIYSGGALQKAFTYTAAGAPASGTTYNIIVGLKANDFAMAINGNTVATANSGLMPVSPSALYIGSYNPGVQFLDGYIRKLAYYNQKLTNAEIQAFSK